MRVRTAYWGMLLLVAVALAPRTASALAVTITYSISGGVANGILNGAVKPGGTISVTHPNAFTLYSAPASSIWYLNTVHFQTTGAYPHNVFTFSRPHQAPPQQGNATIEPAVDHFFFFNAPIGLNIASSAHVPVYIARVTLSAIGGPPRTFGRAYLRGPAFTHLLTLGAEISRVPEPSTFAQLAVGVIGLAAFAAGARRQRRRG